MSSPELDFEMRLFVTRMDCTHRANACACTAIKAKIRIDVVNIAL